MNKRVTSLALAFVMLISLLVTAVPASATAATNELVIVPDKTEAHPGETINYTVYLGPISDLASMDIEVIVPSGLTFITGQLVDGLKTTLHCADVSFDMTVYANKLSCYGCGGYESTTETALFTFSCTVDDTASGDYTISVNDDELDFGNTVWESIPVVYNKSSSKISVTAAPVPATGISLKSATTITAGQTEILTATVEPDDSTDTVTWESNNTAVATVDNNGKVTAVAKGTATITATAGTKSATCTVNVNCAHAHTTDVSAVASTCLAAGHGAYTKCDDCGGIISGSDATLPLADHTYGTWIAEVPATHTSNGTKGHYECSVCHKYFDTAHAEIADLTISNAPHGTPGDTWQKDATNHWKDCVVTGCGVIIESTKAAHTFNWVVDAPATEDATGLKHEECEVCGYKRNEGTVIDKLDHIHTGITKHEAIAATCKSKGNVEYWTCSSPKCAGKYYSDAACTTEITTIETAINPANHTGGTELRGAVDATCGADGYTGDTYCKGCGAKISTGTAIDATGNHTDANGEWETDADNHWHTCGCGAIIDKAAHEGGEATCVAKKVCSVCGKEYGTVDSSKHAHTETRDAKAATEDEEGYTGDTWCTDCNTKIATGTAISKLDHTHNATLVPAKEPTFTEEGNKAYYTCSCDKWYEDAACTVEITDHSSVIIPVLEYAFTAGNNSSYTKGSGKELQFTANGAKDDCTGIKIDGVLIDAGNYTLASGSTIVTLKKSYVDTLSAGEHTISVVYGNREATVNFKIEAASAQGDGTSSNPSNPSTSTGTGSGSEQSASPQTGDNSSMALWIALLFVSGAGVFGIYFTGVGLFERPTEQGLQTLADVHEQNAG